MLALPSALELQQLHAEVKRVKMPNLPAGACWDKTLVDYFPATSGPDGVMFE